MRRRGPSSTSARFVGWVGPCASIVLDNLKEGVLTPDVYDAALNPLYRDVLAHYGVVGLPCRVGDPDRKGKVESGIGHTQKTPLQGMRFETLEEAQTYLDRWDARWADTRIRDSDRSLDTFDFDFNKKMNRALVYELATARFIAQREDVLLLGPPGTGKSHLAQAIGRAAIQQGYRVIYREAHTLLEELTEATLAGTRKAYVAGTRHRPAADHRRPRHAQARPHRRRGSPRAHHASL